MERYICIHGHFYQPPRENPWLEAIELQDSADPYHDWNERITAECYAPNAASRILDDQGLIVRIVNNYSRISFNFGPTLLSWLEEKRPDVYQAILDADRESQERFSGHGSAIAQAYNHMILPLGNQRDKHTQIVWGIRDFEHRFGRKPEGMWLAETAVDLESLDLMAQQGISFTVLSPYQARRVRKIGAKEWRDASGGRIDPTMPYVQCLPSGRSIIIFFYDGPISRGVAFEGLLNRGEYLAHRLIGAFSEARTWPQLVHIATDGETYGHHHKYGEMALSYALHYIESHNLARITNYGEYLEQFQPTHEVDILENTSWSCFHGVDRWQSDCGCASGMGSGWNQQWRAPLRAALNWLRDRLAPEFERHGRELLKDPWEAREDYITVILNRSPEHIQEFIARHAARDLSEEEITRVLKLMELQRHAMLMYTSCGWFFDELSGIETIQVIMYAGRAVQLAQELFGDRIEEQFLARLELAKSNIPDYRDGRRIYERWVRPAMIDLARVGAHYAMSSLFETYNSQTEIYSYLIEREDYRRWEIGRVKLAIGRAWITSQITRDSQKFSFGVIHFGDHNLSGGVRQFQGLENYTLLTKEVSSAFEHADLPQVIRLLDKHFAGLTYSLKSLFRDEQRKILTLILESTLAEAATVYRQLYERHAPLMRFMTDLGIPLPRSFQSAAEFALSTTLQEVLEDEEFDITRVQAILEEAKSVGANLENRRIAYAIDDLLDRRLEQFAAQPTNFALLERIEALAGLARIFGVSLWRDQNRYYQLLHRVYPEFLARARRGDSRAQLWVRHFTALGAQLSVRVPADPASMMAAPGPESLKTMG